MPYPNPTNREQELRFHESLMERATAYANGPIPWHLRPEPNVGTVYAPFVPEPSHPLMPRGHNLILVPKRIDPDRLITIDGQQYLLEPWKEDDESVLELDRIPPVFD